MGDTHVFVKFASAINIDIAATLTIVDRRVSVSTGRAEKSYCIDLTSGKVAALRPDTDNVHWMKRPVYNTGACRLQGVIKVTPPTWSRFVHFHMVFQNPYRFSFNLGDSWKNVAKGRHALSTYCLFFPPFSPVETISTSLRASLYHHIPVLSVFSHVSCHIFSVVVRPSQSRSPPLLFPGTTTSIIFLDKLSSSLLLTCPYQCNRFCLRNMDIMFVKTK